MLQQEEPEDFVLATGDKATVREFLELCLGHAKISYEKEGEGMEERYIDKKTGKTIVAIDEHYYRPAEVDLLVGDPTKAREKLGWEPKTTLSELAKMMVDADLELVGLKDDA